MDTRILCLIGLSVLSLSASAQELPGPPAALGLVMRRKGRLAASTQ